MVTIATDLGTTNYHHAATTERKDGRSYISKDAAWMKERYKLGKGLYFEGCMSLVGKQRILQSLPQLGLSSREFANCAADFVGGKSIKKYCPDKEQAFAKLNNGKRNLIARIEPIIERWQLAAAEVHFKRADTRQ
jgi:hypothetical protein